MPPGPPSEAECVELAQRLGTAEAELAAWQALVATIAHHLRTPLALAATSAELLRDRLGPDAAARDQLDNIVDAVQRIDGLVRNLLEAGRIEAGQVVATPTVVPLAGVLEAAAAALGLLAAKKRQQLVIRSDAALVVVCDRELVGLVVWNLLDNAIKFSPEQAQIELRARRAGDRARCCVVDDGPGIAAADLPRVFERYWQVRATSSQGVGLGLYIARALLEAQGSTIRAESEPGRGSTFCFELPLAPGSQVPR